MANPRQRKKARSGTSTKPSSSAKRRMQNKQHKHGAVIQNAPAVIGAKWDRHKTVQQNFKAMGLLPSLQVHASGGRDDVELMQKRNQAQFAGTSKALEEPVPTARTARIIRDEQGNVVDVVEGSGPTYEEELRATKPGQLPKKGKEVEMTPWGAPLNDSDDEDVARVAPHDSDDEYVLGGTDLSGGVQRLVSETGQPTGKAAQMSQAEREARDRAVLLPNRLDPSARPDVAQFHEQLHALSAERMHQPSRSSNSNRENDWLCMILAKHGDDLDAAARDRSVNPWQKTKGEIRRAIKKAGGAEKLLARQ